MPYKGTALPGNTLTIIPTATAPDLIAKWLVFCSNYYKIY